MVKKIIKERETSTQILLSELTPQWLHLLYSVRITIAVQKGAARVVLSTARRHQLQLVEALLPGGGLGISKHRVFSMVYP